MLARARAAANWKEEKEGGSALPEELPPSPLENRPCGRKILPSSLVCEKLGLNRANATKRQQERKNWDSLLIPMRSPTARKGRTTLSRSFQRSKGAGPPGAAILVSRPLGIEAGGPRPNRGRWSDDDRVGGWLSLDGLAGRSKNPSFWGWLLLVFAFWRSRHSDGMASPAATSAPVVAMNKDLILGNMVSL